jgi:hypothetical protein
MFSTRTGSLLKFPSNKHMVLFNSMIVLLVTKLLDANKEPKSEDERCVGFDPHQLSGSLLIFFKISKYRNLRRTLAMPKAAALRK